MLNRLELWAIWGCAMLLGLALPVPAVSQQCVFFNQASTWKYSLVADADWETLTYDDSSWSQGLAPFYDHSYSHCPLESESGTDWNTEEIYLRKSFSLESLADLSISLAIDNEAFIYVNGILVFHDSHHGCGSRWDHTISVPQSSLILGTNLVAVRAINWYYNSAFDMRAEVGPPDQDLDGYSICQGDCDDTNPNVHPGAQELCNDGIDNNCNGLIDCADPECNGDPACGHTASTIPTGMYRATDIEKSRLANYLGFYLIVPLIGLLFVRQFYCRRR